jgi:hypothetical protein
MTRRQDQFFHIIASLDKHFAADNQSPVDCDRWRKLRRHIMRMKRALDLVQVTLGEPLAPETAAKIGGYVKLGLKE